MSLDNWKEIYSGWIHKEKPVAVVVGESYDTVKDVRYWEVEVAVLPKRDPTDEPIKTRVLDEREAMAEEDAIDNARDFLSYGGPRELDEPRVQHLVEAGLSRSEAVDWWMTEERGMSQSEWAVKCGCTQQAVSDSVSRAREKLGTQ